MAKDMFHEAVRVALEADGWRITHDGYRLVTDLLKDALTVDLGAEKLITAEKGLHKIAVEVKSFLGDSLVYDFHSALGQMLMYQVNIELQEPDRLLYLAIPEPAYERMNRQRVFAVVAARYKINFVIYEPISRQIVKWIAHNE
ncbi:element excision factor XisH family protein [Fibrella aestuarina]|uniref:element excision factor XisH family protein n=1 Tax=Fibrella aestuarina TaxID=651143 RepID=UPI00059D9E6F|nr:element excision factor XisH family protein [Fibrella aestuarina]